MNMTSLPSRALAAKFVALFAICSGAFITADQAKANIITNASDNAGNYSGGWTNGANGGFGFAAWQLTGAAGSTNGFNGAFIGNVPAPNYAPMATASNAFSIYAGGDGGAYQDAVRGFSNPMTVGQTLTHSLGITFDNGNKGFALFDGATEVFFFNVNNTGYSWSGGGSNASTPWEARSNGVVINFSATRTSSGFNYAISSAQDATLTKTGSITAAGITSLKYYISDAGGGDLGNLYFNNFEIAGPAPSTITNQVTFSVNMSYQASQGLLPSNSTVQVRGEFNNWTGNDLTNQGGNIFSGTFNVAGNEGGTLNYKFWNSFLTNPPSQSQGYEDGSDRVLALGTNNASTNLPTVFFSNLAGQRFVTFSVNMAIQEGKGVFNPAVNTNVQVRGDFNGWVGNQLTNQGGSVYSGSFLLSSSATNSNLGYKFYYASGTNDVWEGGGNRSFDLVFNSDGSNAPALSLGTNLFSNELFYATPTSLSGFATTQGTPSTNQSFTVVGLGLSTNIVATAPVGFELSADSGASYTNSLNLAPSSSAYSNSVLARIAASATLGSISNNIQLASLGSAEASVLVTGNVTAAGQSFTNWAQGAPLNSANLLLYSIGGATSPTAGNSTASTSAVTASNLSITAIVRTNDPNLSVVGQSVTDLSIGVWSTNNVTMTPGDQTGVGEGLQKQIWSIPRASDTKKFLRLRSVLTNN
jgi:hypothetical protein